ncbi:hypothetical protein Q1695_003845 [Nippostrongylus brasiliensis]|nr:hypothetical protein Q1695_003845 [Nippostrongylus brasiliensis]
MRFLCMFVIVFIHTTVARSERISVTSPECDAEHLKCLVSCVKDGRVERCGHACYQPLLKCRKEHERETRCTARTAGNFIATKCV